MGEQTCHFAPRGHPWRRSPEFRILFDNFNPFLNLDSFSRSRLVLSNHFRKSLILFTLTLALILYPVKWLMAPSIHNTYILSMSDNHCSSLFSTRHEEDTRRKETFPELPSSEDEKSGDYHGHKPGPPPLSVKWPE